MNNRTFIIVFAGLLLLCLCLAGLVVVAAAGIVGYSFWQEPAVRTAVIQELSTATPTPAPEIIRTPVSTQSLGALEQLAAIEIPRRDLRDLAARLKGIDDAPIVVSETAPVYDLGDEMEFWASNVDTDDHFRVAATLRYATPHLYVWVQKDASADEADLKALADRFEEKTYPTDREFFGSEWTPGVDGDERLYILMAKGLGFSVAGYYSGADEHSRLVHPYSNEHEMFYINLDNVTLGSDFLDGVLAHEFQHMIHWYNDANEDTWMNEGSSELAAFLNGYDVGGFDYLYTSDPDLQLTGWAAEPGAAGPNYGAGFLFMLYFLDRFGEDATQALIADPANGLTAVGDVLTDLGAADPATGQPVTADDVFADWVAANYLGDASAGDGRYTYHNYPSAPTAADTESFYTCPVAPAQRTVSQYGADYVGLRCSGEFTLTFTGSQQVGIVPAEAHSGAYALWSNRGDDSNMTATRAFDLTGVAAGNPITLNFWAWWEIEDDFDYVYVEVSTDGAHWTTLPAPDATDANPNGNNYGWGYTDDSGGAPARWIEQTVDLSQFAGGQIQLRFEYVTDDAINRSGFLLDDVSLPEIGYSEGFEAGADGWELSGWARIDNALPQLFRVQLIESGSTTRVVPFPLDGAQSGSLDISLGGDVEYAVLVVSGVTPITHELASYEFEVKTK